MEKAEAEICKNILDLEALQKLAEEARFAEDQIAKERVHARKLSAVAEPRVVLTIFTESSASPAENEPGRLGSESRGYDQKSGRPQRWCG